MCIPQTTGVLPGQVIQKQPQRPSLMTYQYHHSKYVTETDTEYKEIQADFWEAKCSLLGVLLVDKSESQRF